MMKKGIKYDGCTIIGIILLTATAPPPLVVYSWSTTTLLPPNRRSINTNTQIQISKFNYVSRSKKNIRMGSATLNSKSNSKVVQEDTFKEINIDDVLLEAENALKAAQNSIVDDDDDDEKNDKKILLESRPNNNNNNSNMEAVINNSKEEDISVASFTAILSSTIGGSLLGSLLGSIAAFEISELDTTYATTSLIFAIPILVGISIGGIIGFTGSMQDGMTGTIIRNVLGFPVSALSIAIVDNIQLAVTRQVERTTDGIKAIPSNIANSAKEKALQAANNAKYNAIMTVETALEKIKKVLLVVVAITSLIVLGALILNPQVSYELIESLQQSVLN
ncbi:MAG: hypothetical protein ACI8RD_010284 [Bacillariaceae sp.]|jgi:hypothetical protein